ncbi:MAG TPA: DUF2934 domain-containing protein [Candidatus Acidoferrales bacterium]|jgi:hypothetical protein|nr:DUF2934 domain-containing protein [Candidatus Acidoferrales bacterium]
MAHFCVKTHTPRTVQKTALKRYEPKPPRTPTHEEIARLAYSYWEARGREAGCGEVARDNTEADWLRAERELKQRFASVPMSI